MRKNLPLITLLFVFTSALLQAQNFTDLQNGFPSVSGASTAWADYDGDEDLDFALIGFSSVNAEIGSIYRNDGNGVFTIIKNLDFPVSSGAVSWGDYDHDGDPDLLVNGQGGNFSPPAVTALYRNDGSDVFTAVPSGLPGVIGITRWIDFDGDGWLDVIMGGIGNSFLADSIRLFHNDTTGVFTEILTNLQGYYASDIAVADYDVDGDMDFFFTGGTLSSSTFPVSNLYSNDGNGQFTQVPFPFIDLSTGTAAWADYDHDGDPDLLYDGLDSTILLGRTLLYRNDSMGLFTLIDANLPGSGEPGSVDWADMDMDGDLDILIGGPTTLLRNDGNNVYTDLTPLDFQQGVPCSFADMDHDGDQDILIISGTGGANGSSIHRNELITAVPEIQETDPYRIYPNPVSDQLTIHFGNEISGNISFQVRNVIGQEIFDQTILDHNRDELVVNLSALNPAIYFYTITENGSVMHAGKLIVN